MSCEAQSASSCTTTGVTTTNGNLFVASAGYCCATFTSITDNKSNTYGVAVAELNQDSAFGQQRFIANGSGGATHTFTLTGATGSFFGTLSVQEVSGADSSSPLDQVSSLATPGPATSFSSGSTPTTSQANELLIGFGSTSDSTTYINDGGAGWTERTNNSTDGDSEGLTVSTRVVSATGTYAYTFTTGSSVRAVAGISTWKESAAVANRQRCIGCGIDKRIIGDR